MSRLIVCVIVGGLAILAGCSAKYGERPRVEALHSQLKTGVSTKANVLETLGEPRGYGMSRLPGDSQARTVWFYEFSEATADGQARIAMLIVFFDRDLYAGHLQFEGAAKAEVHW
jgi:hypothetical protein